MPRTNRALGIGPGHLSRPFIGRDEAIGAFSTALARTAADRCSVLNFYGIGGIGKTRLIKEIRRRLREEQPSVAHAQLDMRIGAHRHPATALMGLRTVLHDDFGMRFPTFEIAFAAYWKLVHPHSPLRRSELPFMMEGEVAGDILGALADVPVVGVVARIPRVLGKAGRAAGQWWTRRGNEELRHIAALDNPHEVEEWLPAFWGADLRASLEDDYTRRVVLFLDTFEALWEGRNERQRGSPPDDWVRDWAAHLSGALVVTAGRGQLRWTEDDPTWDGLIEQHRVDVLTSNESEELLRIAGVAEDKVRAAIVERSGGLPYYLDLAVGTYESIRSTEARTPRPGEFDANLGSLVDRFLHYLTAPERAALFVLSVPEAFDSGRFEDLMREFSTGHPASAVGLETLLRYSFMEEPEPGWYSMHALVRDALAAKHDPSERARVHTYLFGQACRMLHEVDPRAIGDQERGVLRDASIHGRAVLEPAEFLHWYRSVEEPFERAAEWRCLLPLRGTALGIAEQRLGPEHPDTLSWMNDLADALLALGRLEEAELQYRQALEVRDRALGAEHPDTLISNISLAAALIERGRLADAEPLLRRSVAVSERVLGPEHPHTLTSVNNLAVVLEERGRQREAETLYRRAAEARERVLGPEHPDTLGSVSNLAGALAELGRPEEAEQLYLQALEGFEKVFGAEHPSTLALLNNMAVLLSAGRRYSEAEPLHRRVLETCTRVLGPEHPKTLVSVNGLAVALHGRGRTEEARLLHLRALEARERVLGPEHPDTLTSESNLAAVLRSLGLLEEAELLFRRALEARERVLGPEHPDTLNTVISLAGVLSEQGQLAESETLFRRAFAACERVLGLQNRYTLNSAISLAGVLREQGQLAESARLLGRALEARERVKEPVPEDD